MDGEGLGDQRANSADITAAGQSGHVILDRDRAEVQNGKPTEEKATMYLGPWLKLPRPNAPGSMHDDEVARPRGYQSGFMGNVDIGGLATRALIASLGHAWYENGAFSISLIKPVFADQEVRVAWEIVEPDPGDERKMTFRVEKTSGEHAAVGWAAAGKPGGQRVIPSWERQPSPLLKPEDDLMPEAVLGASLPPLECRMERERCTQRLSGIGDNNWWYGMASPWGTPVVPPQLVWAMALDGLRRRERKQPTPGQERIWAGGSHVAGGRELLMYGPVFSDRAYQVRPRYVEKSHARSTFHLVTEFIIEDVEGRTVAIARTRAGYFVNSLVAR